VNGNPSRYSLIEASTKTGKSVGCIAWLFEQACLGKPGQNFWWVAPVYTQAEIAWRRMSQGIPKQVIAGTHIGQTISLVDGRTIYFKSGEKPDNLYGEDVFAAVIDEASRLRVEAYEAIRSTLTATRGPMRIIGNVKGRKNWFYKLARRAEAGEVGYSYHKIVAADAVAAGVLSSEEIEDAKRSLRPGTFRELYLSEPSDDIDALWTFGVLDRNRVNEFDLARAQNVVVAVDPSGASSKEDQNSDEIGIVVVARGEDGDGYVLADRSMRDSPAAWARAAVNAYHEFQADHIVAERNFGGEMVRYTIQSINQNVPVTVVTASRSKSVRAEPASALYAKGRVHHVKRTIIDGRPLAEANFSVLEDQMCECTTAGYRGSDSPDRMDALVWGLHDLLGERASHWGLVEHYRREEEKARPQEVAPPEFGFSIDISKMATSNVRLRALTGFSSVYGMSGTCYPVVDGIVSVVPEDAVPLRQGGFEDC
jgi:phage terminase large subunit-like protein